MDRYRRRIAMLSVGAQLGCPVRRRIECEIEIARPVEIAFETTRSHTPTRFFFSRMLQPFRVNLLGKTVYQDMRRMEELFRKDGISRIISRDKIQRRWVEISFTTLRLAGLAALVFLVLPPEKVKVSSVDSSVAPMTRRPWRPSRGGCRSSRPAPPGAGSVPLPSARPARVPIALDQHGTTCAQADRVPAISEAVR